MTLLSTSSFARPVQVSAIRRSVADARSNPASSTRRGQGTRQPRRAHPCDRRRRHPRPRGPGSRTAGGRQRGRSAPARRGVLSVPDRRAEPAAAIAAMLSQRIVAAEPTAPRPRPPGPANEPSALSSTRSRRAGNAATCNRSQPERSTTSATSSGSSVRAQHDRRVRRGQGLGRGGGSAAEPRRQALSEADSGRPPPIRGRRDELSPASVPREQAQVVRACRGEPKGPLTPLLTPRYVRLTVMSFRDVKGARMSICPSVSSRGAPHSLRWPQ
jgi:hypothetical protein